MRGEEQSGNHQQEVLSKPEKRITRILCVADGSTPASIAVQTIISTLEKNNRHDTIIITDDELLVKLIRLQLDSQLRNSRRLKVKAVMDDLQILRMNIGTDAVSFMEGFEPDVLIVDDRSLKYFPPQNVTEQIIIKSHR